MNPLQSAIAKAKKSTIDAIEAEQTNTRINLCKKFLASLDPVLAKEITSCLSLLITHEYSFGLRIPGHRTIWVSYCDPHDQERGIRFRTQCKVFTNFSRAMLHADLDYNKPTLMERWLLCFGRKL